MCIRDRLKPLGHLHIQLDGAALPGAADGVHQVEIQLRAIERAVTLVDLVSAAQLLDGLAQGIRGRLPVLQLTDVDVYKRQIVNTGPGVVNNG